ncbi:hypothetical protein D0U04_29330 [Bacillus clarus]|uniref:Uncharacterized protein n=1 Tax=Bacillus clarus TaxID=2338372 RepID=A0A090ZP37_9BACI|nr:hypothetical protein [Bacillus clarus]KFN05931.1 hypothetical protein DJ93_6075 [Bacillus clarus]RFT61966.1 hypothetical protein D0U04_29330 [Bacillus clarus]
MFKSLALSAASVLMLFSGGITVSANEVNTKDSGVTYAERGWLDDLYCNLIGQGSSSFGCKGRP